MAKISASFICCLLTIVLSFTACDIETADNGNLDGLWQLTAVDTLSTHGHRDMKKLNTSWTIQGKLLQIRNTDLTFVCHFSREGDMLKLGTLYVNDHHDEPPLEDMPAAGAMGVNEKEESFSIITLTSSTMTLQSATLKLSFRKY
jgi:hypothetical protein